VTTVFTPTPSHVLVGYFFYVADHTLRIYIHNRRSATQSQYIPPFSDHLFTLTKECAQSELDSHLFYERDLVADHIVIPLFRSPTASCICLLAVKAALPLLCFCCYGTAAAVMVIWCNPFLPNTTNTFLTTRIC
jgi:hypothetical protein